MAKANRQTLKKDYLPRRDIAKELVDYAVRNALSREEMAVIVDDAASQMSRLMTGHVEEFSADRLVKHLLRAGYQVRVLLVRPAKGRRKAKRACVQVCNSSGYVIRGK